MPIDSSWKMIGNFVYEAAMKGVMYHYRCGVALASIFVLSSYRLREPGSLYIRMHRRLGATLLAAVRDFKGIRFGGPKRLMQP